MSESKEPSEEQREFVRELLSVYPLSYEEDAIARGWLRIIAKRDAAQFRRGVEAAIAIVERYVYPPCFLELFDELRNLRGDDDG